MTAPPSGRVSRPVTKPIIRPAKRLEFDSNSQCYYFELTGKDFDSEITRLGIEDPSMMGSSAYMSDTTLDVWTSMRLGLRRHEILWIPSSTLTRNLPVAGSFATTPNRSSYLESLRYSLHLLPEDLPLYENGSPKVILFPINSNGVHWSLVAYYLNGEGIPLIYYYDSISRDEHSLSSIGQTQFELMQCIITKYNSVGAMGRVPSKRPIPVSMRGEWEHTHPNYESVSPPIICYDNNAEDSIEIETVAIPSQRESWECGFYLLMVVELIAKRASMGIFSPPESSDFSHLSLKLALECREHVREYMNRFVDSAFSISKRLFHLAFDTAAGDKLWNIGTGTKTAAVRRDLVLKNTRKLFGTRYVDANSPACDPSIVRSIVSSPFMGEIKYGDLLLLVAMKSIGLSLLQYLCERSHHKPLIAPYVRDFVPGRKLALVENRIVYLRSLSILFQEAHQSSRTESLSVMILSLKREGNEWQGLIVRYFDKILVYDPSGVVLANSGKALTRRIQECSHLCFNRSTLTGDIRNEFSQPITNGMTPFSASCVVFLLLERIGKSQNILPHCVSDSILDKFSDSNHPYCTGIAEKMKKLFLAQIYADYAEFCNKKLYFSTLDLEAARDSLRQLPQSLPPADESSKMITMYPKKIPAQLLMSSNSVDPFPAIHSIAGMCLKDVFTEMLGTPGGWKLHLPVMKLRIPTRSSHPMVETSVNFAQLLHVLEYPKELVFADAIAEKPPSDSLMNSLKHHSRILSDSMSLVVNLSANIITNEDLDMKILAPYGNNRSDLVPKPLVRSLVYPTGHSKISWARELYARGPDYWYQEYHTVIRHASLCLDSNNGMGLLKILLTTPHYCAECSIDTVGRKNFICAIMRAWNARDARQRLGFFSEYLHIYPIALGSNTGASGDQVFLDPYSVSQLVVPITEGQRSKVGWLSDVFYGDDYPMTLVDSSYFTHHTENVLFLSNPDSIRTDDIRVLNGYLSAWRNFITGADVGVVKRNFGSSRRLQTPYAIFELYCDTHRALLQAYGLRTHFV